MLKDKEIIQLFYNYYLKAKKLNSEKFSLESSKLNKKLGLRFSYSVCKEFVRLVRSFRGMYRLFDLIDIKYDKDKERYKCEVEFVKDLDPSSPGHRKRGKKLFSPKLYKSHLFPRYNPDRKITIMMEPYHY